MIYNQFSGLPEDNGESGGKIVGGDSGSSTLIYPSLPTSPSLRGGRRGKYLALDSSGFPGIFVSSVKPNPVKKE
jgi:hypothetical protein